MAIVTMTDLDLRPDPSRVMAKTFIPGLEDVGPTGSRAGAVVERVRRMSESDVETVLADVTERFAQRHRDITAMFDRHADRLMILLDSVREMSPQRKRLLGAYFTHEYAIEGASLANPSIVPYPLSAAGGQTRFVMSVRCIGEGHRSAIGFRTGAVAADGSVAVDLPSTYATSADGVAGIHQRTVFHAGLDRLGHRFDDVSRLLELLPPTFGDAELASALAVLVADNPRISPGLVGHANDLSRWSYRVEFPDETEISERVLWPHAPPEYHGMEDARFVRFVDDDGDAVYFATYTAYDRNVISLQLLTTMDFRTFTSSPIAGSAAAGKGLAIFPRKVGGRFVALTRSDMETNGIAFSDDVHHWATAEVLQIPSEPWELIQVGNCGSPIETEAGWLVLTHGVGPMRTYCIGALLLDLERPTRILARTTTPILAPDRGRRDGYVPNVVYTCGGLACGGNLVMPFGIADQRIGLATMPIDALIDSMVATS